MGKTYQQGMHETLSIVEQLTAKDAEIARLRAAAGEVVTEYEREGLGDDPYSWNTDLQRAIERLAAALKK